jgi:F0F1-type ATP synthase epsilon subunit
MITCRISKQKETITHESIKSVKLPSVNGEMEVLSKHAEAFVLLGKGTVVLRGDTMKQVNIDVTEGVCHVKNDVVTVIL